MELIDRYVHAVTQHLPEDIKGDVSKELNTLIEDMLPEEPTDADIKGVLEELGNPRKLANEYSPVKKYLIGPSFYDSYISTLKLVFTIVITVLTSITILQWTLSQPLQGDIVNPIVKLFENIITTIAESIGQSFLWVTLVFAIMERYQTQEGSIITKKWTIDKLPKETENKKKSIPRAEAIVDLIFTLFFAGIIILQPQIIAMYVRLNNGNTEITQLLNLEVLKEYIPIIIILTIIKLGTILWKLINRKWTFPLAGTIALYNVASFILIIKMLMNEKLINNSFISKIAEYTKINEIQISNVWDNKIWGVAFFFLVIFLIDSLSNFYKASRK